MATAITGKGCFGQKCARSACDNSDAQGFNQSTRRYYCRKCARTINQMNRADAFRLYGTDLCIDALVNRFEVARNDNAPQVGKEQ